MKIRNIPNCYKRASTQCRYQDMVVPFLIWDAHTRMNSAAAFTLQYQFILSFFLVFSLCASLRWTEIWLACTHLSSLRVNFSGKGKTSVYVRRGLLKNCMRNILICANSYLSWQLFHLPIFLYGAFSSEYSS